MIDKKMRNKAIILGKGAKWAGKETVIRWEEYPQNKNEISLPKIVDEEGDKLRNEYLTWIYELGLTEFGGQSLVQRLEVFPGVSVWCSSAFAEKSFWKTPEIYDVLRLRALELYCSRSGVQNLTLCVADHRLNEVLKEWRTETGLHYEWKPDKVPVINKSGIGIKALIRKVLPELSYLRGFIRDNYSFITWAKPTKESDFNHDGITIFTYFAHLDQDELDSGRYSSTYWGNLPFELKKQARQIYWIFKYIRSQSCPDSRTGLRLISLLNSQAPHKQRFFFLEQWLSWSLIGRALFYYFKIRLKGRATKSIHNNFIFKGSRLNFWPVLEQAWISSTRGVDALNNIVHLLLFRELVAGIPRQHLGICLSEFMGWERSLINCWHASGVGKILGYIHCFVSFFDFRFFADQRTYSSTLPRYDKVIVNSQVAWDCLERNGYPLHELLKAEALRQSYLCEWQFEDTQPHPDTEQEKVLRLLVVTDYDKNVSMEQLKLLGGALKAGNIRTPISVTIKPHPLLNMDDIASRLLPAGSYEILDLSSSMAEALREADIVYASNATSAAIDAAFINLPTIISLSGLQINMSPLRGVEGVTFVSDASQLAEALNNPKPVALPKDFFYLNEDLRLWKDLLEHNGN